MRADGQVTCVENNGGAGTCAKCVKITMAHGHVESINKYGGTWTCRNCKKRMVALGHAGKK